MVKATLIALIEACNFSLTAHAPEGAILRGTASHLQGDMKKMLKKLAKEGYAIRHPTGHNMTYQVTQAGLNKFYE